MATAKYGAVGSVTSNLAGTTLNSLANGSTSAFITHDNSTDLAYYASVRIDLGTLTPTTGGSITLRVHSAQSGTAPDDTGSVGGGDMYTCPLTTTTTGKVVIIPRVLLYPESLRLQVTNNAGVALASSGNAVYLRPYGEQVS